MQIQAFKLIAGIALASLLWFSPAVANAAKPDPGEFQSCTLAFAELEGELNKTVEADSFGDDIALDIMPTVKFVGQEQGEHGGGRIVVERVGKTWVSVYNQSGFDVQGDPRWFMELVGEDLSAYLGFRLLDDNRITIPDHAEFTGAMEKLNSRLRRNGEEPIRIRYYQAVNNDDVSVKKYVREFVENRSLPVAPSGNHLVHDMAFHSGAIFLPKNYLDALAARVEFMHEFGEFIKRKYSNNPEQAKAARYFAYLFNFAETVKIDSATAMLGPYLTTALRSSVDGTLAGARGEMEVAMGKLLGLATTDILAAGKSPADVAEDHLYLITAQYQHPKDGQSHEKVRKMSRILPYFQLNKDLQQYAATYRSANFPGFSPTKDELSTDEERINYIAEFCREITKRRQAIIRAIKDLSNR